MSLESQADLEGYFDQVDPPEEENPCIEQIQSWDWEQLKQTALQNVGECPELLTSDSVGRTFLGTVMALYPSGKFYTPWDNSNVSDEEATQDELFEEALDQVAEQHGMFIFNGEGDPCDLFAGVLVEESVA